MENECAPRAPKRSEPRCRRSSNATTKTKGTGNGTSIALLIDHNADRLPNAVIVGAPRCGSTSLFKWLSAHPEVCGSNFKETYFLMDPGATVPPGPRFHQEGLVGYGQFFQESCRESHVVLEATPGYLYQRTALEVMESDLPNAKLIFILRRPSDRVLSSYHYFSNNWTDLNPHKVSFPEFLEMARREDDALASNEFLRYVLSHGRYVEHLSKWRQRCGAERMHVVLFENLQQEPGLVMKRLATWLGIDPAYFESYSFCRENENYRVRNYTLQHVNQWVRRGIPEGMMRRVLRAAYRKMNTRGGGRPTGVELAHLEDLDEYYREPNRQLKSEFNLDLTSWDQPRAITDTK